MKLIGKISIIRTYVSIGLVSAAIIAYQLVLMQILSYVQWYHFAYMIISVALLGFGAAGTFLTICRKTIRKRYSRLFPILLIITAVLMPLVVLLTNTEAVHFDSLLVFQDFLYAGRLIATYFLLFLPFFSGALALGMTFLKYAGKIGKIYFSNLLGSGLGGIVALLSMQFVLLEQLPLLIASFALAAGFISIPKNAGKLLQSIAIVSVGILITVFFLPPKLKPSEYKDISKTLLLPASSIEYDKSSPYGEVQVVSSPVLRYAPGVSLSYRGAFPVRKAVFNNGNWCGYLVPRTDQRKESMLNFTTQSLPYRLSEIENALILDAGTGENISLALSHKVREIIATEANPEIFHLLQHSFVGDNEVKLHQTLARMILISYSSNYDLIELPIIGSFFGNSGLNAIEPSNELSMEAFHEMWNRLSDNGMISLSCWMDYPVRKTYRLLASIDQLLEENGILYPEEHIIAIRSWSAVTFLVKKTSFNKIHEAQAQQFCNEMMFDPLILPGTKEISRGKYNLLQDTSFFMNIDQILYSDKKTFIERYPFRIQPVTDNRPFFFQHIRWNGIQHLISTLGAGEMPFLDLGYVLVLFTFIQILFIACILILLPLFIKPWKSKNKLWVFVYFSGIGLAYMFIEIVFIQKFTFYFGQIIYATAASISILLISSGLGSYFSGTLQATKKMLLLIPVVIIILLLFYVFILSEVFSFTMAAPMFTKTLISIVLIGIPGFFMGMPFPIGVNYLYDDRPEDIPWAWAFNGYFSVISTALAIIVSVEAGYAWLLLIAAITYALAGLSNLRIKK